MRSPPRDTNPSLGATLAGRVIDTDGTPIAQAVVALVGTADSTATSDDGRFAVHNAPPGAYMVSIRRLGFRPERFAATLALGQTRDATIILSRFVPVLPTVTTTASERAAYRAVGFDQRMRAGQGQFLTYDQIVHKQATEFTQLLQGMRGIWLTQNPKQFGTSVAGTRGVGSCVAYVVDGVPQHQMMEHDPFSNTSIGPESPDNLIDLSQVGAIEVYSSAERPVGFGGMEEHPPRASGDAPPKVDFNGQQCGLVMVWTRARLGLPAPGAGAPPTDRPLTERTTTSDLTRGRTVLATDSACRPGPARDTTDLLVYATVEGAPPRPIADTSWAQYKGRVLAALDRWSALPSELFLPAFGLPFAKRAGAGGAEHGESPDLEVTPTLSTVLLFTLDATGTLRSAHVVATSLSPGADTSMLAMVERAAAAHDFPPLPAEESGQDSVPLYLVVESVAPAPGTRAAVLGQLEVPVWRLARPARLAAGTQPADASRLGRDATHADSVRVKVVVDPAGHAVMRTARLEVSPLSAGRPASESAARLLAMLTEFRFEPALIGSCRVPELVIQSFFAPAAAGGD